MKLSLAREELARIAKECLPTTTGVVDHLPDSIAPPIVLVAWSDPWLKSSTLCAYECAMELIVVAQRLEPGGKLETLEDTVSALLPAIKTADGYQTIDVTSPYPLQIGGVDYLAASINLTYDVEDE